MLTTPPMVSAPYLALDALDVLGAAVFRDVAEDGRAVDEDERVARVAPADGDADASHRVDGARDADLAEDDVLDGLRLFLRDVLRRDDGDGLRIVFRLFLCGVCLYMNVGGTDLPTPRCTVVCPYGTDRRGKLCADGAGEEAVHVPPSFDGSHDNTPFSRDGLFA